MTTIPPAPVGNNKAFATVIGGAVSTILIYALDQYVLPSPLPDLVVGAIGTIVSAVACYLTPHSFGS